MAGYREFAEGLLRVHRGLFSVFEVCLGLLRVVGGGITGLWLSMPKLRSNTGPSQTVSRGYRTEIGEQQFRKQYAKAKAQRLVSSGSVQGVGL